ncbi:MAG: helix-turn-helix transcriptional regulator [Bacillaceae bacterium]|nr:helix-turn-helix transcriptional regulator [Bacillaceae bacterium]
MKLILKDYLEQQNKTTYWLRQETGISHKAIYDLVNNKTKGIRFDSLEKICKALSCTPNDLFKLP